MITFEVAQTTLLKEVTALREIEIETVPLWEAGGRVLAEDVVAYEDIPHFDRSPVDGFALIAADTIGVSENNSASLEIKGSITAGAQSLTDLEPGTVMKIFTGAPLPPKTDCIIKVEDIAGTFSVGEKLFIRITRPLTKGENVACKGEDIAFGQFLFPGGTHITPAHLGILATLGVDPVPVYKKPLIGIFSTGNELVVMKSQLMHGQIRASNIYTLAEIIRLAGAIPVFLGVVRDSVKDIIQIYEKANELDLPLVISTGGTASGDNDVIKDAMVALNSLRLFDKVAIRPGAPVVASVREKQLLVGLSGNPSGSTVATLTLLFPVISRLAGFERCLECTKGKLKTPLLRKGGLRAFLWAIFSENEGCLHVEPHINQFCGAVKSYFSSNCLVDVPAGGVNLMRDDLVVIWKLPS